MTYFVSVDKREGVFSIIISSSQHHQVLDERFQRVTSVYGVEAL